MCTRLYSQHMLSLEAFYYEDPGALGQGSEVWAVTLPGGGDRCGTRSSASRAYLYCSYTADRAARPTRSLSRVRHSGRLPNEQADTGMSPSLPYRLYLAPVVTGSTDALKLQFGGDLSSPVSAEVRSSGLGDDAEAGVGGVEDGVGEVGVIEDVGEGAFDAEMKGFGEWE